MGGCRGRGVKRMENMGGVRVGGGRWECVCVGVGGEGRGGSGGMYGWFVWVCVGVGVGGRVGVGV